jgi:hypothetical protein
MGRGYCHPPIEHRLESVLRPDVSTPTQLFTLPFFWKIHLQQQILILRKH